MGFASLDFLSGLELVCAIVAGGLALAIEVVAVVLAGAFVPETPLVTALVSGSLGKRVVRLAMGTVRTLVRYRVSISAVTDMPGKNNSFSLIRMWTSNFVASWLLLLPVSELCPSPLADLRRR